MKKTVLCLMLVSVTSIAKSNENIKQETQEISVTKKLTGFQKASSVHKKLYGKKIKSKK